MSFRTVVIKNRCKLEYSLNYLVCRKIDSMNKVLISEIDFLIIESTGVALTSALISALVENKVKVIFCDEKANPCAEIAPYFNHYSNYKKIMEQISFDEEIKNVVWQCIIQRKISNQRNNLIYMGCQEEELLGQYCDEVRIGDITNREGHAAKVYFNALFGKKFARSQDTSINAFLNYGYSIILSAINREVKINGYLTELGIHHKGETNPFNLSCDLMEPLRPLVDLYVLKGKVNEKNFKTEFVNMLNMQVTYCESVMYLENAIRQYVRSVFKALANRLLEPISFIEYEL